MDMLFLAHTFDVVGKIFLGVTVLGVHGNIVKERRIDSYVINKMRKEKLFAIMGIVLIVVGYLITLIVKASESV